MTTPSLRAFVVRGDQFGFFKSAVASTMTDRLFAQETVKPNWLDRTPKVGLLVKIDGDHNAV